MNLDFKELQAEFQLIYQTSSDNFNELVHLTAFTMLFLDTEQQIDPVRDKMANTLECLGTF